MVKLRFCFYVCSWLQDSCELRQNTNGWVRTVVPCGGRKAGGYLHKRQVILVANQQDGLSGAVLTGLTGLKANGNQVPGYTLTVSQFYLNVHYCTDDSTTMQSTVN